MLFWGCCCFFEVGGSQEITENRNSVIEKEEEKVPIQLDLETFGLQLSGSFEALLCSSVYRLYYEAIQYLKIEIWGEWVKTISIYLNCIYTDYSKWPLTLFAIKKNIVQTVELLLPRAQTCALHFEAMWKRVRALVSIKQFVGTN